MTQPKSHQGWGLAEGSGTHAKPQRLYQVPPAHRLPKLSTACKQIYTSYKSMRQRGYTTASDEQWRGRQPDLPADPQTPRLPTLAPFPLSIPMPLLTLPLAEVHRQHGGTSPAVWSPSWQQPGLRAQVTPLSVGCGRPAGPTRSCGGLPAAHRPATCRPPPPYLAPRRPQSGLWGPRGGAGLRRPPGLCVSSTSGRCLGVEFLLSLSPGR